MSQVQNPNELRALLIARPDAGKPQLKACLEATYGTLLQLKEMDVLQDAVEHLESEKNTYSLIVFEHHSPSMTFVKLLLELGKESSFVMVTSDQVPAAATAALSLQPELISNQEVETLFPKVLKKLATVGKIPQAPVLDGEEYFSVRGESLLNLNPLKTDVFVRLGQGRFVCLFKKGVQVEEADIQKYREKRLSELFYIKRVDCNDSLKGISENLDREAAQAEIPFEKAKEQFAKAYPVVQDVVTQIGFTPQAQNIAKSCVNMSLKLLGSRPKLSRILTELKKKDGNYIVAHSFMVGQVACALAHKLDWSSTATYLKLSLAAFLHDITLNNPEMAAMNTLEEVKKSNRFEAKDIHAFQLHTVRAAEYSKQFSEIPSDVDQIISQHHERPDGSGFPRQINGKLISPLSAVFIISHDLVHYFYDHPSGTFETFFETRGEQYQIGQFRKIFNALKLAED